MVMGTEFTVVPWGWGTNLRYFHGDGDSGYGSTRGIADCRSFSLAGRTLEERRSQLSGPSVDGLLFLHGLK